MTAASVNSPAISNEFGSRRSGWNNKGAITQEGIPLTSNAVEATITVGATQAAGITIQMAKALPRRRLLPNPTTSSQPPLS